MKATAAKDAVNHPAHYTQGPIEVIDIIEGFGLGFHLGNVVKYVLRAEHKGGTEDLKKAAWYLNRYIEKRGGGMIEYLEALDYVLQEGERKPNRTGIDTLAVFGYQMRFNLAEGFPILTTKKIHFKSVKHELLWMIAGGTNVKTLNDQGVRIWDEWADEAGELGPIYGFQWRHWSGHYRNRLTPPLGFDQLSRAIEQLRKDPTDRRIIVSAWNAPYIEQMRLPPCHALYQFLVTHGGSRLNVHLFMRSADIFLGVPFNIASYALLLSMVSLVCGLTPGELVISYTDLHLYVNHIDQAKEQLTRDPSRHKLPELWLDSKVRDIDAFTADQIELLQYESYPAIKAEVAV
jgi:thymidylate synthase